MQGAQDISERQNRGGWEASLDGQLVRMQVLKCFECYSEEFGLSPSGEVGA